MTDRIADYTKMVKEAYTNNHSLTIQGGGTKSFLGRAVSSTNHILDNKTHSGILVYEPIELIMQARSGTTIEEIENTLAEKGQCLSSEPGHFGGKATLGGSLASNMSGPSRPFAGSLRDHILGVSLINGVGEHLKFGGQVIKNVAGYDISRLQAGAMGSFGVMTDISFKVMPKWKHDATYVHSCDAIEALRVCNTIAASEKPVTAAAWFDGQLYLRFATNEAALENSIGAIEGKQLKTELGHSFWSSLRDYNHLFFDSSKEEQIYRISVKSGAPHPVHIKGEWAFDWAGSQRFLKQEASELNIQELQLWASRYNAEIIHLFGGDKTAEVHTQVDDNIRKIQLNLKKSFDPRGIFNPGRLYEWM